MLFNSQVAGQAQGTQQSLAAFFKSLNDGPRAAHVVKLEKEERDVEA